MNATAISKLPTKVQEKIGKRPTNTQITNLDEINKMPNFTRIKYKYTKLPNSFNGRKVWPGIDQNVFDQGDCGSCWAFSTCSLLSDRYLILSAGKVNVTLSPTRLLLCDVDGQDIQYAYNQKTQEGAREAGKRIRDSRRKKNSACYGNTLMNAFQYLFIYGACTTTCIPYNYNYGSDMTNLFSPLYANLPHNTDSRINIGKSDHNTFNSPISKLDYVKSSWTGLPPGNSPWTNYDLTKFENNNFIPSCAGIMGVNGDMCINWNRGIMKNMYLQGTPARFYRIGLWYVINFETLVETNEAIRQDIYKWGPVVTVMEIFENFYEFDPTTTIYSWDGAGVALSAHAVEIVGWGIDGNTKYWWIKNSWGKKWGIGGYFKIKRGVNECKIEDNVMAALPDFFTSTVESDAGRKKTYNIQNSKMGNIYGVDLLQLEIKNKQWEFTKVNSLKLYRSRGFAELSRIGLDLSLFSGIGGLGNPDGVDGITQYMDFVHDFSGGIDPYTGFTRRAMLMHTGLDFTPPITSEDINFAPSYYAAKHKIKELVESPPMFISNYIFYMTISILALLIFFLIIKKYQ